MLDYDAIKNDEKRYYVADFETTASKQYEIEGITFVYMWYIENIYNDSDRALGLNIHDFINWLLRDEGKEIEKVVYFHNLTFDVMFIEYYLNNMGIHNNIENEATDTTYSVIRDEFRNVYQLIITRGNVVIEFRDSLKLLQSGVARLPNLRGLKKLEGFDYQKIRTEQFLWDFSDFEIEYIKHDVWIVKDVLKELLPLLGDHLTIASSSYADFINIFTSKDKWKVRNELPPLKKEDEDILRKAYNGGIVAINPRYKGKIINKDIVKYDVNSLYSSVMYNFKMPYSHPARIVSSANLNLLKARGYDLYVFQIEIHNMTIKKGFHPFYDTVKNYTFGKKRDYPRNIKNQTVYLSSVDLSDLIKYYDMDYTIIFENSFAFKSKKGIFKEYIEKYNHLKENASNEFERLFAKFRLNTLYGKFGTRAERTSLITSFVDSEFNEFIQIETTSKKKYYLPIAIFITAYARHILITAMQNEKEGFVYADTDSIHIIKDKFNDSLKVDSKKLGYWDYEGTSTKSLYYANKQYLNLIDGKMFRRVASLNRENHHLVNFDNMKKGYKIKNGKRMRRQVKGGYIIRETDFTFT